MDFESRPLPSVRLHSIPNLFTKAELTIDVAHRDGRRVASKLMSQRSRQALNAKAAVETTAKEVHTRDIDHVVRFRWNQLHYCNGNSKIAISLRLCDFFHSPNSCTKSR